MNAEQAKGRILQLTKELNMHNYRYYVLSSPVISDFEFDMLLKELEKLEKQYPDFVLPDSPAHRVGGEISKEFTTVAHTYPMLSLGNCYSQEELLDFDKRARNLAGENIEYVCELKFDGLSISLVYEDGLLVRAVTRGDGLHGDDVTNNVRTIRSIPLRLIGKPPVLIEARGEIILSHEQFSRLNTEREEIGERPFANPRNAASGSLKLQDPSEVARRGLDSFIYQVLGEGLEGGTHFDYLKKAVSWGFRTSEFTVKCANIVQVMEFINDWEHGRDHLPYDIDGVVVKVNSFDLQKKLGITAKSPRWAIAYKYQPDRVSTRLLSVVFQVGRTGAVTPVANLEPVQLSGSEVKRASLHNSDVMASLDIRNGDVVFVEKGGEVIPKIVGVDLTKRMEGSEPVSFARLCPDCNTPLIKTGSEAAFYCPNVDSCPTQIKGRIEHFISRDAMDISTLGEGKIDLLFSSNLVRDPADLYDLRKEDLLGLEKVYSQDEAGKEKRYSFREKTVQNILDGIKKSKGVAFDKVLYALGIRFVGSTVARKLALAFGSIDKLMNAPYEELIMVNEIGDKIAGSINGFFGIEKNKILIKRLRDHGLQFEFKEQATVISNILEGKSILATGKLQNFSREEIHSLITAHSGKPVTSISKNIDFIILGEDAGANKIKKAAELGIPFVSEEEFRKMLG